MLLHSVFFLHAQYGDFGIPENVDYLPDHQRIQDVVHEIVGFLHELFTAKVNSSCPIG